MPYNLNEIDSFLESLEKKTTTSPAPTRKTGGAIDYRSIVEEFAPKYPEIPKDIVENLIIRESSGDPYATADTKKKYGMARGVGQFIDETAARFIPDWKDPSDSYNPRKSIEGTFRYLTHLKKQTGGDIRRAIELYHGGGTDVFGTRSTDYAQDILGAGTTSDKQESYSLEDIDSFLASLEKPIEGAGWQQVAGGTTTPPKQLPGQEEAPAQLREPLMSEADIGKLIPQKGGAPASSTEVALKTPKETMPLLPMTEEEYAEVEAHKTEPYKHPVTYEDKKALAEYLIKHGQKNVLSNLIQKSAAFGKGFLDKTPGIKQALGEKFSESAAGEALQEKEVGAAIAGGGTAFIIQAFGGGAGVGAALSKTAIGKSPILTTTLTRMITSGAITAKEQNWKNDFKDSLLNTLTSTGAGAVAVIPEVLGPANAWQLLLQPLTDLVYDVGVGVIRGQNVTSKEWLKNEALNLAISEGFAIKDVASGDMFKATQSTQRAELNKWLKNKKTVEIIPKEKHFLPESEARMKEFEETVKAKDKAEESTGEAAQRRKEKYEAEEAAKKASPMKPEERPVSVTTGMKYDPITGKEYQTEVLNKAKEAALQKVGGTLTEANTKDYDTALRAELEKPEATKPLPKPEPKPEAVKAEAKPVEPVKTEVKPEVEPAKVEPMGAAVKEAESAIEKMEEWGITPKNVEDQTRVKRAITNIAKKHGVDRAELEDNVVWKAEKAKPEEPPKPMTREEVEARMAKVEPEAPLTRDAIEDKLSRGESLLKEEWDVLSAKKPEADTDPDKPQVVLWDLETGEVKKVFPKSAGARTHAAGMNVLSDAERAELKLGKTGMAFIDDEGNWRVQTNDAKVDLAKKAVEEGKITGAGEQVKPVAAEEKIKKAAELTPEEEMKTMVQEAAPVNKEDEYEHFRKMIEEHGNATKEKQKQEKAAEPKIDKPWKEIKDKAVGGFLDVGLKQNLPEKMHKGYQDIVNRFHSINRITDIAKTEADIKVTEDPAISAKLYLGVQGKAETKLFWGRHKIDDSGNIVKVGESLQEITKNVPKEKMEDFDQYLIYRRVPELEERGIKTGFDLEKAKESVKNNKQYEKTAAKFTEFMHSQIHELVDAGLISADKAKTIIKQNQMYASYQRVMDDLEKYGHIPTGSNIFNKVNTPIHKIKGGSARPIKSPIESAIKSTYLITNAIERNNVAKNIVNLRKLSPKVAEIITPTKPDMTLVATLEDGTKIFRPKQTQGQGIIEVFEEGKRKFYTVPKDLYETMTGLTDVTTSWFVKMLAAPARLLRTGATTVPEFALRNPFRDQWAAFVNAKHGYIPFYDFGKGLFSLVGKTDDYWKYKASGAEWATLVDLDRVTTKANMKKLAGIKEWDKYVRNPISLLEDFSSLGEQPTRLGVFGAARKKVSDIEAAVESREASVDFARRGARMKVVSSLYTFLNARLQGIDKFARTVKENPIKASAKITAVAVIPSVINYLMNRDDPTYWEIPQWQRDMFWIVKAGETYLRIPKGDVGVMFGTTAERILQYTDQTRRGQIQLDKLATNILKESMPISDIGGTIPTAFRPFIENITNYSFFRKRPIVPHGKQKLEPYLQHSAYTSEIAKKIGKALNVSPSKMENLLIGYTGGLGRHGLKLADIAMQEVTGKKPPKTPKQLADYPAIGAFAIRNPDGFNSESVAKFYEIAERLDTYNATVKSMQKKQSTEDLLKYNRKHFQDYISSRKENKTSLYREINKARTLLGEIRRQQEEILESNRSIEKKEEAIKFLDRAVMGIVVPINHRYTLYEEKAKRR